jgi:hypothetical protein
MFSPRVPRLHVHLGGGGGGRGEVALRRRADVDKKKSLQRNDKAVPRKRVLVSVALKDKILSNFSFVSILI